MLKIEKPIEFDWDEGNEYKNIDRHGITNQECEILFVCMPLILEDTTHSVSETRFWVLGEAEDKHLHVTFTMRGKKVRVISARKMSRKERSIYEKAKANTKI